MRKAKGWLSGLVLLLTALTFAVGCGAADLRLATRNSETMVRTQLGWGKWIKWLDPVFRGQYPLVGDPSVLREGALLRMFYTCFDPDKQGPDICQATSTNGFAWDYVQAGDAKVRGRMLRPGTGPWEDTHETSFALKFNGLYFLYFAGYIDRGGALKSPPVNLGLATSVDGVNFTPISSTPVLRTTPGGYDNDAIISPSIIDHGGQLYMIYTGYCWNDCPQGQGATLLGATSMDGINWTKQTRPLLEGSKLPPFFKQWAGEAELVKGPDGLFYLFYTALQGDNPHVIGVGRSRDPFGPWELSAQPIVVSRAGRFDAAEVVAPSVLIENGKVRLWFAGFSTSQTIAVGYAEADWPLK